MTETPNRRDQPVHIVDVPNSINMVALLGPNDEHLALIESSFDADVHVRGNRVTMRGESAELALAERLVDELVTILRTGQGLTPETVERAIAMLRAESQERPADVLSLNILSNRGRTIRPKTLNQKRYVDSIDKHTITFGIGPAGTGKTYLAMAKAVQALQAKNVNRIILTRPAVEAGERLGYLPGTLSEKIDPYLRPLYDALHDMIDPETIPKLMAAGTIEVAPLAYMRGRAQPLDAEVATPDGFRQLGSLEVGDLVIGRNGLRLRSSVCIPRVASRSTGSRPRTAPPPWLAASTCGPCGLQRTSATAHSGRSRPGRCSEGSGGAMPDGSSCRSWTRWSSSRSRFRSTPTRSGFSSGTGASPQRPRPRSPPPIPSLRLRWSEHWSPSRSLRRTQVPTTSCATVRVAAAAFASPTRSRSR